MLALVTEVLPFLTLLNTVFGQVIEHTELESALLYSICIRSIQL